MTEYEYLEPHKPTYTVLSYDNIVVKCSCGVTVKTSKNFEETQWDTEARLARLIAEAHD